MCAYVYTYADHVVCVYVCGMHSYEQHVLHAQASSSALVKLMAPNARLPVNLEL